MEPLKLHKGIALFAIRKATLLTLKESGTDCGG
jgi:hypothetical protein